MAQWEVGGLETISGFLYRVFICLLVGFFCAKVTEIPGLLPFTAFSIFSAILRPYCLPSLLYSPHSSLSDICSSHIILFLQPESLMGKHRHEPCPMLPPELEVETLCRFWWQGLFTQSLELLLDTISLCNIWVLL